MGRGIFRLRLMALFLAFYGCGLAGFMGAARIGERTYLAVVYGPTAVQRDHLHVVYDRPTMVISNGDRASELADFTMHIVLVLPLIFVFVVAGIAAIRTLTKFAGRRVSLVKDIPQVWKESPHSERRFTWQDVLSIAIVFGLTALTLSFFDKDSLWLWLRNYTGMILIYSVLLRLLFIGSPVPMATEVPTPQRKSRFVSPL
jgi:hypothetical protein